VVQSSALATRAADEKRGLPAGTLIAFVALGLGVIILANDFSALNVSLPAMEKDFDTDVTTVQWVINAYALVFGVLIVTGGRLADLLGRKRIFLLGATIFAAFSLLGGLAPNVYVLIFARALMGVGGALMWPAILGMTYAALPEEKAGIAGGLILGAAGVGQAIGPLTGGVLTEFLSWRWVLFVNVPIAAFAMLVLWRRIHQVEPPRGEQRIDYAGSLTLSVGLLALLFALDQGTDWGWSDWRVLGSLVLFGLLLAAFVPVERRGGASALVPGDLAGNRGFIAACAAVALVSSLFFASLLYLPQYMQKVLDYSPTRSGVALLPLFLPFAGLAFVAGPLYGRLGAKLIVSLGTLAFLAGGLLLSFVDDASGYLGLLPGLLVLGIAMGFFYPSVTTAGVTAVAAARQSLAGGLVYMFQIAGGAVGLGLSTTVFATMSERDLDANVAAARIEASDSELDAAQGILAGTESARRALAGFPGDVAHQVTGFVNDAFVTGFDSVFRLGSGLAALGLVVAVLFVGGTLVRVRAAKAVDDVPSPRP
jgi:EmrB/QacA subfamily drug resistance transporter